MENWFSPRWLSGLTLMSDDVEKVHRSSNPMSLILDQAVKCNRMLAAYDELLKAIDAGAIYPAEVESAMLGALLSAVANYRKDTGVGGPEGWLLPGFRRL